MKVSRNWLQKYFTQPLPNTQVIADAFTFHAFEVEEILGDVFEVKVLPNRAADCLCHRGLARELSAILDIPLTDDPLRNPLPANVADASSLTVTIEDAEKCIRYSGTLIRGVKVDESPTWLKEALESVGQRSINNVVDATNYVMQSIGQPLHAFDAGKLTQKDGNYAIAVRTAKEGEKITTLSGDEMTLSASMLLITDAHSDVGIGIAGIKGGKIAEVTTETTDIILESANFDGTTIRRTAQKLKLFSDASQRFQNRPSPELVAYGMRDVIALITSIAGGEVSGVVDVYNNRPAPSSVANTFSRMNGLLGSDFSNEEITSVFRRLDLDAIVDGDTVTVTSPFERTDLLIPEDLTEEVVRVLGYDRINPTELAPISGTPDQARFKGIERMKDQLVSEGFIEVSTQSFVKKGDILLANPLDKTRPMLRTSLEQNLTEARSQAIHYAPLVLPSNVKPKLFEVGTVFLADGEHLELRMTERVPEWGESAHTVDNLSIAKLEDYGKEYTPAKYVLGDFKSFSAYPFIVRDIALWVEEGTEAKSIETILREKAGDLLVRLELFDEFKKEGRVSYAFRLVFQSFERTLTDDEINPIMETIYTEMKGRGFEVR